MVESLKNWLLNDVKITSGNEHEAAEISKLLVKGSLFFKVHTFSDISFKNPYAFRPVCIVTADV